MLSRLDFGFWILDFGFLVRPLSFVLCPLSFVFRLLLFAIHDSRFTIHDSRCTTNHLPFTIYHLPLILCFLSFAPFAFAQKDKPVSEQKSVQPAPSPSPKPSETQNKISETAKTQETKIEPQKAAEPFDGASVEKMARQCVTLETEMGDIEMEVFPKDAPETVRNFLNLASIGAFDTMKFTRVVKDFVIQSGNAGSRENLTAELWQRIRKTVPDEPNEIKHVRGVVSIARPEEPNKASCQFFILVGDAGHLDGKFSAFARVTKGMDIVDTINKAETEGEKPLTPVRIKRAVVTECK